MTVKPLLIIQPRRMGDLILTFPLLLDLRHRFPSNPIWLAARENFFKPLMPFAPVATFFPLAHLPELAKHEYELILNLGGSSQGALCAELARAEIKLGVTEAGANAHIQGFWQLYRESLTQNNRHNLFHWSDLFRMDLIPLPLPIMRRPLLRTSNGRIGLFVGASEAAKRPEASFWVGLSARLAKVGFKPVLLGGPNEAILGAEIMAKGARAANFCGKTDLTQLAALLRTLDLLITPDTGPMHLADWLRVPVLNLSMGNVQALETGPLGPGQYVLRSNMSCSGCWGCTRSRLCCHIPFKPAIVATLASAIVQRQQILPPTPGLEVLVSGRDNLGLYALSTDRKTSRNMLDKFWRCAFLSFFRPDYRAQLEKAAQDLRTTSGAIALAMRKNFGKMLATLARCQRKGETLPETFWRRQPWHSRLFAGHMQMSLQNEAYSPQSRQQALQRVDELQKVLCG